MLKHQSLYERKFKKLGLQCKICGSSNHQSDICLHQEITDAMTGFLNRYLRQA